MMNVLIIFAHPDPESYNHAVLEKMKEGLEAADLSYNVIDLYRDHFNPALVYGETLKRRDLANDPETKEFTGT